MDARSRRQVTILYADSQPGIANTMRAALVREGFHDIIVASTAAMVSERLRDKLFDLLVVDVELPDGDVCETLRAMRADRLGVNPFVPVIATMWKPAPALVKAAVDAGVDDLLVKPISPAQVIKRLQKLSMARKGFVVTGDYIGPDRRRESDRTSQASVIEVPNTLKMKAEGEVLDPAAIGQRIREGRIRVNVERVSRAAFQILFLVRLISIDFTRHPNQPIDPELLARLKASVQEIECRSDRNAEAAVQKLRWLDEATGALHNAPIAVASRLVQALLQHAPDLLKPFLKGMSLDAVHRQIGVAAEGYRNRRAGQAAEDEPATVTG